MTLPNKGTYIAIHLLVFILCGTVVSYGQSCSGPITEFPHNVDFETDDLNGWSQGVNGTDDDIDWWRKSGSTPSGNTGPSSAYQGDYYIYTEASGSNHPEKEAVLLSPCFGFGSTSLPSIEFVYHMLGGGMGSFHLEVSNDDGATWTSVWSRAGDQSTDWIHESVNLTAYQGDNIQLRFRSVTGPQNIGWQSDIAIDHITVYGGAMESTATCSSRVQNGLLAYYTFQEGQGSVVHDISGVGIPMNLSTADTVGYQWVTGGGLKTTGDVFFSYDRAARKVFDAIQTTNSFSVELWVAPSNTSQDGPARIVTYSENTSNRNFTVGQELEEYHVRVRTSDASNSGNGTPALESPAVMNTDERQHVVYTFDGATGQENLYVNGLLQVSDLRPGLLSNWDENYIFGIFDETAGARNWYGTLYSMAIYDTDLSSTDIFTNIGAGAACANYTYPVALACDEYADVDLICTGLENDVPNTITIPDTTGLDSVRVEIVYKGGNPGPTTTVTDDQGTSYVATGVTMASNATLYSFDLPATASVTYSNTTSSEHAQSMCLYTFTSGVSGKTYVTRYTEISALPNRTRHLFFELPQRDNVQDVSIVVPISEVTYDNRNLSITASAGGVSKTVERTWGSGGSGFPDGCCVDTMHIILPDVPADAIYYSLTIEGTQSYVLAGILAVKIDCGENEICNDGLDNDFDGLTDCDDSDCSGLISYSVDLGPDLTQCNSVGFSLTAALDGCADYGEWSVQSGNATLDYDIYWTEMGVYVPVGESAVIRYTAYSGSTSEYDEVTLTSTADCSTECVEPINENGDLEDEGTATNFNLSLESTPALLIEEDINPRGWDERYGGPVDPVEFNGAYYIKKTGTEGDPYSGTHFAYLKGSDICLSTLTVEEELPCGSTFRFSVWVAAYSYNVAQDKAPFALEVFAGGDTGYTDPLVNLIAPASNSWNDLNWQRYSFDITIPTSGYTWADFYFTSKDSDHGIAVDDVCITMIDPGAEALAGPDQHGCDNTFDLVANTPSPGYNGSWSVLSGDASVTPTNSPTAIATINSGSAASLLWTVDDGTGCAAIDEVTLGYANMDDIAVGDTTICEGESVELSVAGCNGSVLWSTGETTSTINVAPGTTTDYTATCTANPGPNLMYNPGFENPGALVYWYDWSNSSVTTVPEDVHSGSQAIVADAANSWAGFGQAIYVDAGSYYEMSVWAKCSNVNRNPVIQLVFYDSSWESVGKNRSLAITSVDYEKYSMNVVIPVDAQYVQVYLGVNGPYAKLAADDFSLMKISGCIKEATTTVTVIPELQPIADSATSCPNEPSIDIDLSDNDTVPTGSIYTIVNGPTDGHAGISDAGMLRYTAEENYCGVVTIDYAVCYQNCCEQSQVTITIEDDVAPILTDAGADMTIACDNNTNLAPATVSGTDNCQGQSYIIFSESIDTTSCASAYTINRAWTTEDACGNTAIESRAIIIEDDNAPTLLDCPADITVDAENIPAVPTVTPVDACSSQIRRQTHHLNNELRIPNTSEDFMLPQFSPDLGNLVAVEYYVGQYLQFRMQQENTSLTSSELLSFSVDYSHDISGPSSIATSVGHNTASSAMLAIHDGSIDYAGPSGYDYGLKTFVNSTQGELTSNLSDFIGNGNITFTELADGSFSSSGGGNANNSIATKVKSNYTITYVYTDAQSPDVSFTENIIGDICDDQYTIDRIWTMTDPCGNQSTCSQSILVNTNLPEPSIALVGNATDCAGTELVFSVPDEGASLSYDWSFGANASPPSATGPGPHTVTYVNSHPTGANQGNTVTVTVGKGSCTVTDQTTITVRALPEVTVDYTDADCEDSEGSVTFYFQDNTSRTNIEFSTDGGTTFPYYFDDTIDSVTIDGLAAGTYDLMARWGNDQCPVDLPHITISSFDAPVLSFLENVSVCEGEELPITAVASGGIGVVTYTWDNGLGNGASKILNPVTTTTYTVTVQDSNGCIDEESFTVTVFPSFSISLDVDQTEMCEGDTIQIGVVENGYDYQWNSAAGNDTAQYLSLYIPAQTGSKPPFIQYSVTVTDGNGCTAEESHIVQVFNLPTITTVSDTVCIGDEATISALANASTNGGATPFTYLWSSGDSGESIAVTSASTTDYTVTATDQQGCAVSDTATVVVNIPSPVTMTASQLGVCEDNPVFITVDQSGMEYQWDASAQSSTTQLVTVYPSVTAGMASTTTNYAVTVTDVNDCPVVNEVEILATKCTEICGDGIDNDGDGLVDSDDFDCICYEIEEYSQAQISAAIAEFDQQYYGVGSTVGDRQATGSDHELSIYEVDPLTIVQEDHFVYENNKSYYFSVVYDPSQTGADKLVFTMPGQVLKYDPSSWPTDIDGLLITTDGNGSSNVDFDRLRLSGRVISEINDAVVVAGNGWLIRPGDISTGFVLDGLVAMNWSSASPDPSLSWSIQAGKLLQQYKNPLVANIAVTDDLPTICEGTTTTLTASATGGSGDYMYTWDHGLGTGDTKMVSPSDTTTYTVTVRDTSGCESFTSFTVNVVEQTPATSSDDVSICEGEIVSISAAGGDSYLWSNGLTGSIITVAPAITTTYFVEVTNIYGCYDVEQVVVTVSPEMSAYVDYNGSPCFTDSTTISAVTTGGTAPFAYQWVGPAGDAGTDATIPVDTNGNYYVTITDTYGCEAYSSGFVYQRYEPNVVNLQSEVCEGDVVSLSISGSTASDYQWSANTNNATTPTVYVTPTVPASTYSVTVTSSQGCEAVAEATIAVNPKPTASFDDGAMLCLGETSSVSPSLGGVWSSSNPFIVSVNNAGSIVGLAPGTAALTYTEQSTGCSADAIIATVNVNPTVVTVDDVVVCNGQDVTLMATGSGSGTLSYMWDNGLGAGDTKTFTADGSDSLRTFDTYEVTVSDGNGCTVSESVDVTIYSRPMPVVTHANEVCGNGNGTITFTFDDHIYRNTIKLSIDDGDTYTEVSDKLGSFTFSGLQTGTYDLVTEWGDGDCPQSLGSVELLADPIPSINVSYDYGTCGSSNQGSISLAVEDAPLRDSLLISLDGGMSTYLIIADDNSPYTIAGLSPGTYDIVATWQGGDCPVAVETVVLHPAEYPSVSLTADLSICEGDIASLMVSGGDEYLWSTGVTGEVLLVSPTETTTYYVTASSNAGCDAIDSVTVTVSPELLASIDYNGSQCVTAGSTISATEVGGTGPYTYSWEGPAGLTADTKDVVVTEFGTYYLTVTDVYDCTAETSGYVYQEFQAFIINLQTDICEGEEVDLTVSASAGTDYQWSSNAGSATTPTVTVYPTAPSSSYVVTVTNNIGCQAIATADISVTESPEITLSGNANICIGESTILLPAVGGIWISSDPTVANVTYNGIATGLSAGTSYMTFINSSTGCESEAPLLITVEAIPEVYFTGASSICLGESTTLYPDTGGTWSSSDESVAAVSNTGLVTSVGPGLATFTYTDTLTSCTATTSQSLIVQALPVTVVPSELDLCIEATAQAYPATGGIWSSTHPSVASINNAGVITAVSSGQAAFVYTNITSGCTSLLSDSITVQEATSLAVSGLGDLCIGETTTLSPATGGVWSTNNSNVATVTNTGLVSAVNAGVATFTYTDGVTGCETTLEEEITVFASPVINMVGASQICVGSTTSYTPTTGGVWTSSNPSVAIIANDGIITGLSAGTATFTFTDTITGCDRSTMTPIAVLAAPDITLEGPSQICVGTSSSVFPANGGVWISDNPSIATVSLSGVVTGVSEGTAVLVYTESNSGCQSSQSISIDVLGSPTVSLTGSSELCEGETTTVSPTSGGVWLSTNPFVATVTDDGVVTAHSTGLARFTFISDAGCTSGQTSPLIVYPPPTAFVIGESSACIGNNLYLEPSTGGTWASSDTTIATISNDGTVIGISPGQVSFVYTDSNTGCVSESSEPITIEPGPVVSISGSSELCLGEETNLAPTTGGVWSSSNPAIATIDNTGGVVAVSPGSSTFIYTDSGTGCQSEVSDTVTVLPPPTISYEGNTNICIGNTTGLLPSAGGTWVSNNIAVATVTSDGTVTAISQGVASFTYIDGESGCESLLSPPLTVNNAPTVSFTGADEICIGGSTEVQPAAAGTWTSSDETIATVDTAGIVLALSAGTVTLSYAESGTGCTAAGDLVLTVSQPADVTVTGPLSVCIGGTTLLSPSTGGVWTSSNPAIATVDNNGLVRGLAPGAVTFEFLDGSTGCAVGTTTDVVQVLSCINHDFNVTTADLTIESSIATNDHVPVGTIYSGAYTTVAKPNASTPTLTVSEDGEYLFTSSVPGKYIYSIPVCTNGASFACSRSRLEITVLDNVFSVNNPVVNLETAVTYTGATDVVAGEPVDIVGLANDKCVNTSDCSLSSDLMSVTSSTRHGTVAMSAAGVATYTPQPGYIGFDTLTYEVCVDGDASQCSEAMQIFTINHLSAANSIYAADNFAWTIKGTTVTEILGANIGDAEGDVTTITPQGTASSPIVYADGEYYIDSNGELTYTPAANFTGHTEIIYTVCDDNTEQMCQQATVHLLVFDDLKLEIRVYLEGALIDNGNEKDGQNRPLMRDDLREGPDTGANVIPTANPYKYAVDPILDVTSNFMHVGAGLLDINDHIVDSAAVFGVTGPDAIVDWIYVQLRSKNDMEQVLATRCGLLQRDGDVVDLDGVSELRFQGVNADSFYVMVKHRLHLGAMSGLVSNGEAVDFTSLDTEIFNFGTTLPGKPDYTGLSQNTSIKPGYQVLWGGDFDGNGHIKFTNPGDDQNFLFFEILLIEGNVFGNINYDLAYGYYQGDYNMNGKAKFTNPFDDLNYLFFQVLLYERNTDYFTNYNFIYEQVPTAR